jgi:hypothetical protein
MRDVQNLENKNQRTHLIKYPGELQEGDVIIHNNNKYHVNKYIQGNGMAHDLWGEYGILHVQEIRKPVWFDFWRNIAQTGEETIGAKKEQIQTYEKYPFIVELSPIKEKQS